MLNESVEEKLARNAYNTRLAYPERKDPDHKAKRLAYNQDERKLRSIFQADVLDDLGLINHPKADLLWEMAWEHGHSDGLRAVYDWAHDLMRLIK